MLPKTRIEKNMFFISFHSDKKHHEEENTRNVKARIIELFEKNDEAGQPGFNEVANRTNDPREVIIIINQYDEIIKSHNKWVI